MTGVSPERCGAFVSATGEVCILETDHGGEHQFTSDQGGISMHEVKADGTDIFTDRASLEKFVGALEKVMKGENKSAAIHGPGSVVRHADGARYVVQPDGSWKRQDAE